MTLLGAMKNLRKLVIAAPKLVAKAVSAAVNFTGEFLGAVVGGTLATVAIVASVAIGIPALILRGAAGVLFAGSDFLPTKFADDAKKLLKTSANLIVGAERMGTAIGKGLVNTGIAALSLPFSIVAGAFNGAISAGAKRASQAGLPGAVVGVVEGLVIGSAKGIFMGVGSAMQEFSKKDNQGGYYATRLAKNIREMAIPNPKNWSWKTDYSQYKWFQNNVKLAASDLGVPILRHVENRVHSSPSRQNGSSNTIGTALNQPLLGNNRGGQNPAPVARKVHRAKHVHNRARGNPKPNIVAVRGASPTPSARSSHLPGRKIKRTEKIESKSESPKLESKGPK